MLLSVGVSNLPSGPGCVIVPSAFGLTVPPFGVSTVPSGLTVEPFGTLTAGAFSPGLTVPPSGKVTLPSGFCSTVGP